MEILKQKVSVAVYKEETNEMIGLNLLYVVTKNSGPTAALAKVMKLQILLVNLVIETFILDVFFFQS